MGQPVVSLVEIERMLDGCAKGHEGPKPTTHSYQIKHKGEVAYLPKGPGGASTNPKQMRKVMITLSKVRNMVDKLKIDRDCAKEYFRGLKFQELPVTNPHP